MSILLRLCWDEADSLGLAGLLFARLSPPLREKRHVLSAFPAFYQSKVLITAGLRVPSGAQTFG